MANDGRPRGARALGLERGALGLGLVAGLVLLVVALGPVGDARSAGEARLGRLAGETCDAVTAEWQRLLRDPAALPGAEDVVLRWRQTDADAVDDAGADNGPFPDWSAFRGESPTPFDALIAAAEEKELAGNRRGALADTREALAKATDPRRKAEGRLRCIQLAAQLEDAASVASTWATTATELTGGEARGEISYLLLSFLAAKDLLDEPTRTAGRERLLDAWTRGTLALPANRVEVVRGERLTLQPPPLRLALATQLGPDPRLEADLAIGGLRTLLDEGWIIPAPASDAPAAQVRGQDVLLVRRDGESFAASFLRRDDLESALISAEAEHGLVPEGFHLSFDGADPTGTVLRENVPLVEPSFHFTLSHEDTETFIADAGGGARLLRATLALLGLLCAAAGVAISFALRKERRLQQLRLDFVANVSHELRTPLSSILLMAENLESGRAGGGATPRYHALIRREAQRLRRLVDDVLDFSRLERGQAPKPHFEEVELERWCASLESEAREWVARRDGELEFRRDGVDGIATLDAEALRRAVLNLVDNSLRHSGRKEVRLTVRNAGRLRIEVRDFGHGVPAEDRERIFRPFERRAEVNGSATGAGLGLAIVRQIVAAHGGSVSCEPPPDADGALFVLEVPLRPAVEVMDDASLTPH